MWLQRSRALLRLLWRCGGGRTLPRDTGLPNRNGAVAGDIRAISAKQNVTPDQRYGGIANLTRDSFAGAVGSTFKLSSTSGTSAPFWLRLLSVTDLSAPPADQSGSHGGVTASGCAADRSH